MRSIFTNIFICIFYIHVINGSLPSEERGLNDLIENIPSLEQLPDAEMFAGHLIPINPNNITESSDKRIYYWLNRSQDPESKTLIIWLNGGPGCSSLFGLFAENGPLMLDPETGRLTEREYSWNRFAHTLYFELPTSVGFSYTRGSDRHQVMNENTTVTDIVGVFYRFLEEHERYKNFDIYLAGESYAGMWIPQAAQQLIQFNNHLNLNLNFKGIILGNPHLNNSNSYGLLDEDLPGFLYSRGIVSKDWFEFFTSNDCLNINGKYSDNDFETQTKCDIAGFEFLGHVFSNDPIDPFHVTRDCWWEDTDRIKEIKTSLQNYNATSATPEEITQFTKNTNLINLVDNHHQKPSCTRTKELEKFLSYREVQEAFHANFTRDEIKFTVCSQTAKLNHLMEDIDMGIYIKDLVTKYNKTALIYYGDQDLKCNFVSGQEFVSRLGLKKTRKWTPHYIKEGHDTVKKVVGFTMEFVHRLKYATIKGAGHMAPSDKPEATYNLISNWIARNRDN